MIQKIILRNYKKFSYYEVDLEDKRSILVGDNDAGKSSILTAIDLVLSGSRYKVEKHGIENLLNVTAVNNFLKTEKRDINELPELIVELYLAPTGKQQLVGTNNILEKYCDGLRMSIAPNPSLTHEIQDFLADNVNEETGTFPYDYYVVTFVTFAWFPYSGYHKFVRHLYLDSSKVSASSAMHEFVREAYNMYVDGPKERAKHSSAYRVVKNKFRDTELSGINGRVAQIESYRFELKNGYGSNIDSHLTLSENGVTLENSGQGRQSLIKTEFSLKKSKTEPDIVLLEEPENHLSQNSMEKLISLVEGNTDKQVIIATHSNTIASRLNLKNCLLISSQATEKPIKLDDLSEETAKFFMKSPTNNILDLALSKRAILVEGAAEYILMELFFEKHAKVKAHEDDIQIIPVNGLGFKRHIEVVNSLGHKVAIIRDNDGDYTKNCVENYREHISDPTRVRVFAEKDDQMSTFEKIIYRDNKELCDKLFKGKTRSRTIEEYMLSEKTEAAFELSQHPDALTVPQYIQEAIDWIRK